MLSDRSPASGGEPPVEARDHEAKAAIARNALSLVAGQAATTVLAIVLTAALGRSVGAQEFGLYYLVTTMSAFAYVFVEWGQPLFVIRQVAMQPQRSGDLLGTALFLRVAWACVVSVPVGLIAWALGYDSHTIRLAVLLVFATLPMSLAQGHGMVFRARDRMGRDAAVSVANKAVALGAALPALAYGLGVPGVILAQAIAGFAALALAGRLHGGLETGRLRFSSETARDLLRGGAPILAMTAATSAQPYLDAILLTKLAPADAVGWFGAAKNILGTLMAPAVILGAAAYPRLARASSDPAALRREVRSAFRPLLWLAALAGTGTYLFAGTVIGLIFGARGFGPAATILEVFAPGLFLLFIDVLLGNILYASGRGTGFAVAKIASVVVGTVLDVLLIPFFQQRYGNGGMGVVVAFALSELVVFAGALLTLRPGTLAPAAWLDVARALGAAATTLLLFWWLPPLAPWIGIPLCVAAFTAASLALGLTDRHDLAALSSLARRPSSGGA